MTELVEVDACTSTLWSELASRPGASVFVSPPWLATLADTYEIDCRATIVVDEDGPRSGMVHTVMEDAAGRRLQSLPFSDFADPVLGDEEDLGRLLDAFLAHRRDGRAAARVLHTPHEQYESRMAASGEAAWHEVSVGAENETVDSLWDRLGGSARRNVRKSLESGITVRISDDLAAVDTFFDLHLGTRKHKYRLLPQPHAFFTTMHKHFETSSGFRVALAEHDGRPIGAILLLDWNGVSYYKFNASSQDALKFRPNDLLMWESMKLAHERGNRALDLGVSDLDQPGLIRYKSKFATSEAIITTFSGGENATDASIDLKRRLGTVTEALTDDSVPDWVTARAGETLYRYFS